jgi:formylglycine-generating enzyme required for sulfatase activity
MLGQGFWIGKYEVTKAQWEALMEAAPWAGQNYVLDDPASPAVHLSWNDAKAFISALNGATGMTFRLPSEAEWEYACRAGSTTRFYWGDDPDYTEIANFAWFWDNAWSANERYAHVVGQKTPNALGLFDMSGNVWEWCEDDWHDNYTGAPGDGRAWIDSPRGSTRVVRGGGFSSDGEMCRSASRDEYFPSNTLFSFGFRLCIN